MALSRGKTVEGEKDVKLLPFAFCILSHGERIPNSRHYTRLIRLELDCIYTHSFEHTHSFIGSVHPLYIHPPLAHSLTHPVTHPVTHLYPNTHPTSGTETTPDCHYNYNTAKRNSTWINWDWDTH